MKKQINEIKRIQQLAGLIKENQFYGDFDENSVRQMLIDAGKDPQEVDNFMNDEEGYFTWSNMTFNHQPTISSISFPRRRIFHSSPAISFSQAHTFKPAHYLSQADTDCV